MIQRLRNFLFVNQTVGQTITKNTFWLLFGRIGGRVVQAAMVIYAFSALGKESYGAFSYALSLAAFLTIFSDIGINGYITREASRSPEMRKQYLAAGFFVKVVLLAVIALIVILFSGKLTNIAEAAALMPIIIFVFAFDTLRELGAAMARGLEKMQIDAGATILTNVLIAIFGFLVLIFTPSSFSLAIAYAVGSGLGFLVITIPLSAYFKDIIKNFSKKLVKPVISAAWPFGLLSVMGAVMINTDILMLGWMRSAAEVGLYTIAQKPIQFLYLVAALVTSAFFPVLSRFAENQKEKFRRFFEEALRFSFLLALPLTIGGIILGNQIMDFICLNEGCVESFLSFKLLAASLVIVFPSIAIGNAIFAHNRQRELIPYVFAGIFGNIIFNLIFIPFWGITGVALSTLLNQVLINTYLWFKMKRISYFTILSKVKRVVLASVGMGIAASALLYLGINMWLNVIISAVGYFGLLYLLREPLFSEVRKYIQG